VGYKKHTTTHDSDSIVVLCQARPGLFGVEILAQRGGTADTIIKGRRDASDITSDMTMAGTFYGGLYVLHTSRSLSLGNDLAGERLFVYRDSTGGFDNETIQGDLMADRMYGNGGSDTLRGNGGPDLLSGGLGNDILDGGQGTDILNGDAGADTLLGGQGADRLRGGEGVDVVNYGTSPGGVKVNFFTGMGSGGDATGDSYHEIENVVGSNFADVLTGTFSSNSMVGGGGADQITGEYGSDRLTGGRGADRFIYREVGESVSGNRDVIMDFRKSEGDKIQISAIDGKASTTAMNSFRLLPIGSNFTAEGQIRVAQSGAHTIVYFNTIGASGAEMEIQLSNFTASTLTQSDFITGGWLSGFAERTAAPRSAAGGISENPTSGLRSTWVGLNFSSPVTGQDAGTMTQSIRKDSVVASSSPTMEKYSTTLATQSSVDAFPVTADVQFATDLAGIDSVFSELDDVL
jgi:Ca2+-binding RTX toxin-like protein